MKGRMHCIRVELRYKTSDTIDKRQITPKTIARKTSVLRHQCKILDFTSKNANILYEKHTRI